MSIVSRTEQSRFARWWWTLDKPLLIAVLLLALLGLMLSFATSPVLAERISQDSFFLVRKQLLYLIPAVSLLLILTTISAEQVKNFAIILFIGAAIALLYALIGGAEYNGARRWILLFGTTIQPVEFIKPAFVVIAAGLIAKSRQEGNYKGQILSFFLLVMVISLLMFQPDVGQALLLAATWGCLIFLSGVGWGWILGMSGMFTLGVFAAYQQMAYVKKRLDAFLNPETSGGWQLEQAEKAFSGAGWFGKGPGEGIIKNKLPDAHSDFVFAVAAEEFGIIACIVIVGIFSFIVLRGISKANDEQHLQRKFAAIGLFTLFGLQSIINIGVNLQILPPKGMTLPFVSAGGSSLLGVCITLGFAICLTKRRAGVGLLGSKQEYYRTGNMQNDSLNMA